MTIDETRRADTIADGEVSLALVWGDGETDVQEAFSFVLGISSVDEAGNEGTQVTLEISDPGVGADPDVEETASGCATTRGGGVSALALSLLVVGGRRRVRAACG